jgi:molybdate transport system permease protein
MQSSYLALLVTLKLAFISSIILLLICLPLGLFLTFKHKTLAGKLVYAFCMLPLILPPSVLGFYLLIFFGWLKVQFAVNLLFSFWSLVLGSVFYSLPFVLQPILLAFKSIDKEIIETAIDLGANKITLFLTIILPLSKTGIAVAYLLGFMHTIGEFGVILMIGGNIEGKTQTLAIKLYNLVETFQFQDAHILALSLVVISFVILLLVQVLMPK